MNVGIVDTTVILHIKDLAPMIGNLAMKPYA